MENLNFIGALFVFMMRSLISKNNLLKRVFNLKNNLLKKIPAVFITAAILFTAVFSMSLFVNAATNFSPRLTAPSSSNQYYYSDKNIFYKYGYGMPNCTAYAFGRAYELLKKEPNLCHFNAEEWYDYNKNGKYYNYGSSPKLGAIACWSYNGGGHVAVVEEIKNNKITFSNSGWGYLNFYLTYADVSDPDAGESQWNFQGYIYIGDFTSSTQPATQSSTYKTGIYQTDVDDSLNMRSGVGTSFSRVVSVPDGVKLTVTDIKAAEGYNWGYTTYNGKNGWVALEYCKYISELPTTKPVTQPTTKQPATQPTTKQPATQPATKPTEPTTLNPSECEIGDTNCDGLINVLDATMIQKHIADLIEITDEQIKLCDFDGDGIITVMDATSLQQYIVK